jgi:hypothetical protein
MAGVSRDLSVRLFVRPSVCLSVCLSFCVHVSACLVCLSFVLGWRCHRQPFVCTDEDFAKEITYLKEKVDAGVRALCDSSRVGAVGFEE